MNILEELHWRGLIAGLTGEERAIDRQFAEDMIQEFEKLSGGSTQRRVVYCGFDPTADSLHVGNLVPLLCLKRFQAFGWRPIALAGGATGLIGDPSGKTNERQLLTREALNHNIACVKVQLSKLLKFEGVENPALLLDNFNWTKDFSYLDFLRDIGKHFSVNQMIQKESVRARMEDREAGISYTEFSYMLLQAFDFYYLCKEHNCEWQIGGSDQWGNITAGIGLIRKKLNGRKAFGLTLPLITNADGSKFGKTAAGAVWLDPEKTKEEDFYQFWIRTDDRDVICYLKYFTFLSREEIEALEQQHNVKPESRVAHKALAQAMMNLVHPSPTNTASAPTLAAEQVSKILYSTRFEDYTKEGWEFLTQHWHTVEVKKAEIESDQMPLQDLLILAGLSASKSQARKDIEGRGIRINNNSQLQNAFYRVGIGDLQLGKYLLLRKGKKNYVVVTAK